MDRPIDKLGAIRFRMMTGELSRTEAFALAGPLVAEINAEADKVAKQFKRKHKPWNVIKFLRT